MCLSATHCGHCACYSFLWRPCEGLNFGKTPTWSRSVNVSVGVAEVVPSWCSAPVNDASDTVWGPETTWFAATCKKRKSYFTLSKNNSHFMNHEKTSVLGLVSKKDVTFHSTGLFINKNRKASGLEMSLNEFVNTIKLIEGSYSVAVCFLHFQTLKWHWVEPDPKNPRWPPYLTYFWPREAPWDKPYHSGKLRMGRNKALGPFWGF